MSPEPFDSRVKALPAKRREKGYGDENAMHHFANLVLVPFGAPNGLLVTKETTLYSPLGSAGKIAFSVSALHRQK